MQLKSLLLLIAVSFIIFTGCQKSNLVSPSATTALTSSGSSSQVQAIVVDQHFDIPGPFFATNDCTGEVFTLTGTIGDDIHTVINGNRVNLSEHVHAQLEGAGSFGNSYFTNIQDNVAFNGYLSDGAFKISDVSFTNMISKSGATNLILRRVAQLTVNANGVVTIDSIVFTTSCPGH